VAERVVHLVGFERQILPHVTPPRGRDVFLAPAASPDDGQRAELANAGGRGRMAVYTASEARAAER
jgi:hypothetical protein